jgi:hypothetical protein
MNEDVQYKLKRAWEQTKGTVLVGWSKAGPLLVTIFTQFLLIIGKVLLFVELKYHRFHESQKGKEIEKKLMTFRAQLWPMFLKFGSLVQKYTLIAIAFIREQYGRFITTPVGKRVQETVGIMWSTMVRVFIRLISYIIPLKSYLLTLTSYLKGLHLMTPPLTKEKKKVWAVIGAIGIVVFVLLNIYTFRYGVQLARKWEAERIAKIPPAPTPTPTPTPIPFTHKGSMKFTINSGASDGPKMTRCAIDPLDFSSSPKQTFTVEVNHSKPVTSVTAVLFSDNTQKNVPLKIATGSATSGTWKGSWNVDDTAWYRYQIAVQATDGKNTSDVVVTLR